MDIGEGQKGMRLRNGTRDRVQVRGYLELGGIEKLKFTNSYNRC